MSIDSLIRQASGEAAKAAERVRQAEAALKQAATRAEKQANARAGQAAQWIDTAAGHIDRAAKLAASASATLNRVLPAVEAAVAQRGAGILSAAAGKFAGSGVAAIQAAGGRLQASVEGLGKKLGIFGAAADGGGAAGAGKAALEVVSSAALKAALPTLAQATAAAPHLLTLAPDQGDDFHFGLSSTAFETLRRQSAFGIESVPRLGRPDALQAVGQGSESLSLSGAIFLARSNPAGEGNPLQDAFSALESSDGQLDRLRKIGLALKPLRLTTGHGQVLGQWYMTGMTEEHGYIGWGGHARKQTYTLEFKRYGDDYQKL